MPPVASFGWPPRLFEPETATVQSEFDPGSRLAGLKATLGTAGLVSFLISSRYGVQLPLRGRALCRGHPEGIDTGHIFLALLVLGVIIFSTQFY